jgi:mRNA interferase RelE/StbE
VLLEQEPRPSGCRKLTGESQYRVRVGDYRIVYDVRDRELLVLVLRVAHRRDVYRP